MLLLLLLRRMGPALSQALLLPVLTQSSCQQQRPQIARGRHRPQQQAHTYTLQPAAVTPVQLLVVANLHSWCQKALQKMTRRAF